MKIISHLLLLIVGAAFGVWWGVNHPTQAASMAAHEQKIVAEAKIKVLEELNKSSTPAVTAGSPTATPVTAVPNDKVQEMLDQSHKDLDAANQQLQGQ